MSLELKSKALKELVSTYNTEWFLGDISFLMKNISRAHDQIGHLSSPLRQLYYLVGLNISSNNENGTDIQYDNEKWQQIIILLNEIELEYYNLFSTEDLGEITEEWKRVRQISMPSFLSYFNQGPLNYEEQVLNWVRDLFIPMNDIIYLETNLVTEDFIEFYESIDNLIQKNFQAFSTNKELLRPNWKEYAKVEVGIVEHVPDFIREMGDKDMHLYTFMADHGIMDRFYAEELISDTLTIQKVQKILNLLSVKREERNFLYYTETRPGNLLYEKPILSIDGKMYQVFEVKQIMHAIELLLEKIVTNIEVNKKKFIDSKGKLLEKNIVEIFSRFLDSDYKLYTGYYVDGCEQDILFLWKEYAFIIEAKGYSIREPFRDPNKAFVRIKDDFDNCIGYAYKQTRRVEQKFINGEPLKITDKNGNIVEEIDTTKFKNDFSIIVNLKTFGQIQCDLSSLIHLENAEDVFPWAIKYDDLEVFLLTLIAYKERPEKLVDFLLMRESLHGKLFCADELEVCGAFLSKKINRKKLKYLDGLVTTPDLADIFDKQYYKTMGFRNEKYLEEKQSGEFLFL
ncbi:hypothetical protein M2306_001013 [Myroides gitamensis]|uniref:NERD domain-containing protein n=1 Tax=Myroides odoratus TaxID=256 RepID=UPI002167465D|nr:NERD domain-containing protein [Myroides odoratus]MCS4240312.1 hypothetical protein [Myroides odoratus]MDH6600319.1 hypothetical protein [Myroides gitamensis]